MYITYRGSGAFIVPAAFLIFSLGEGDYCAKRY